MTNYNDGNWHGWNGGECPVHPKTVVDAVWAYDDGDTVRHRSELAASLGSRWADGPGGIIAFRVVKEYRAPREWWVWECADGSLIPSGTESYGAFKVREVIE